MWFLLELSESPQFSTVVGFHIRVIFILQLESVFDIPYHTSHDKAHLHKQGNIDKYIWAICGCAHCASQWRLWHFDINVSRMILVQIISSQQFHSSKHTLTLSPAFSPSLSLPSWIIHSVTQSSGSQSTFNRFGFLGSYILQYAVDVP